jgi:hypothetical protein
LLSIINIDIIIDIGSRLFVGSFDPIFSFVCGFLSDENEMKHPKKMTPQQEKGGGTSLERTPDTDAATNQELVQNRRTIQSKICTRNRNDDLWQGRKSWDSTRKPNDFSERVHGARKGSGIRVLSSVAISCDSSEKRL